MLNKFQIIGRLAQDPELKYTPSGKAVANLRVAVNRWKEENGIKADFFDVTVWDQRAEYAANNLIKGQQVYVEGKGQFRHWEAKDGTKRLSFEIVKVSDLLNLDHKASAQRDQAPTPEVGEASNEDFNDPFADQ